MQEEKIMATATNIELKLYRSGLLRAGVNAHHLQTACKSIARHVARIGRHQLNACNGIPRCDVKKTGSHKVQYTWYA